MATAKVERPPGAWAQRAQECAVWTGLCSGHVQQYDHNDHRPTGQYLVVGQRRIGRLQGLAQEHTLRGAAGGDAGGAKLPRDRAFASWMCMSRGRTGS